MKFKFEKLGLLDEAELELADLTIICGENNTGKTYATYAVYGFLRSWRGLLRNELMPLIHAADNTKDENYQFDLQELFSGKLNEYLLKISSRYIKQLPDVFAANPVYFKNAQMKVTISENIDFKQTAFDKSIKSGPDGKVLATLSKEKGSDILKVLIADDGLDIWALTDFISDAIAEIVFAPYLPNTFIASAERTGAAIFLKELDFARTGMVEALRTLDAKELQKNPFLLHQRMQAGSDSYAWPVRDNVDFIRQLEDFDKDVGELATKNPALLTSFDGLIGGSYKVIKDRGLVFKPKGNGKPSFSMGESSSCVRALLDIGFYLRCKAKAGDVFIIDEPELNLHPKNQRALARLIARMVNAGIKVFVTTHSDYLIKELNTLIMLAQRTLHTRTMQLQYKYDDEELLNHNHIRLYMTGIKSKPAAGDVRASKINTLIPAVITDDFGIEVTTFDTTIEEINAIQENILYGGDV